MRTGASREQPAVPVAPTLGRRVENKSSPLGGAMHRRGHARVDVQVRPQLALLHVQVSPQPALFHVQVRPQQGRAFLEPAMLPVAGSFRRLTSTGLRSAASTPATPTPRSPTAASEAAATPFLGKQPAGGAEQVTPQPGWRGQLLRPAARSSPARLASARPPL